MKDDLQIGNEAALLVDGQACATIKSLFMVELTPAPAPAHSPQYCLAG